VRTDRNNKDKRVAELAATVRTHSDNAAKLRAEEKITNAVWANALARAKAVNDSLRRHLEESRALDEYLEKTILGSFE
jgi:hypothetical protein